MSKELAAKLRQMADEIESGKPAEQPTISRSEWDKLSPESKWHLIRTAKGKIIDDTPKGGQQ